MPGLSVSREVPYLFLFGGRNEHVIAMCDLSRYCVMYDNSSTFSGFLA